MGQFLLFAGGLRTEDRHAVFRRARSTPRGDDHDSPAHEGGAQAHDQQREYVGPMHARYVGVCGPPLFRPCRVYLVSVPLGKQLFNSFVTDGVASNEKAAIRVVH